MNAAPSITELVDQLDDALGGPQRSIPVALTRLLATGHPVVPDVLAQLLPGAHAAVAQLLAYRPDIERAADGTIVAAGLSLRPTPHRLRINGQQLYTWCPLDTLIYPVVLGVDAQVSSTCPVTAVEVQLTVWPDQPPTTTHPDLALALARPTMLGSSGNVRCSFCAHAAFLLSRKAVATWQAQRPDLLILSLDAAYRVGAALAQRRLARASAV